MTEEMKNIIYSKDKHIVVQAYAGCVDKDTEYFNGEKWVKISEYKQGDKVLQFNKDWTAELVEPLQYIKAPCDKLYHFKTRLGIDMQLSAEHRVIYVSLSSSREFGAQNLLEISCEEMVEKHLKYTGGFYGKFIKSFKGYSSGRKIKSIFSCEDDIRLYMAVLSDGSLVRNTKDLVRVNLKKERKKERLEAILNSLGIEYAKLEKSNGFHVYKFRYDKFTKDFNYDILDYSREEREVLFYEIPYWDGDYARFINRNGNTIKFNTTNKRNADFIQLLGASLGFVGSIRLDDRVGQTQINYDSEKEYIRKSICYEISFTTRKFYTGIGNQTIESNKYKVIKEVVPTDGMKYCFTVPSHMLVLRRNNHIFITGNSGKSTTMLEYVKSHPNEKILFLVFNKSMATDFSNRLKGIPNRCEVKTIHSLAYRWYLSKGFPKKNLENLNIVDIQNILGVKKLEYDELSKVRFYYNMFLASNVTEPKDLELLERSDIHYIPHVVKLWKYFTSKNSSEMQHNVYLKMFQMSKVKLNYDTIILDESNDSNHCMLDILVTNMDKKVIAVGDSRQMINSFNFNVDGLTYLAEKHGFKEYRLTNSFRVSEKVASLSSRYMQYMYDDPKFRFNGLGTTAIKKLNLEQASKENPIHLLCRTRLGGLKQIANVLTYDRYKKVYYMGGLKSFGIDEIKRVLAYNGTVYLGGKKFHISELRRMKADGLDDAEVNRIISMYDFVRKDTYVVDILENSEVSKINDADIIVLTSHSSKGLTLKNVILGNDFPPIEETKVNRLTAKHSYLQALADSEANLLYVALTRATGFLDYGQTLNKTNKREYEREELDY